MLKSGQARSRVLLVGVATAAAAVAVTIGLAAIARDDAPAVLRASEDAGPVHVHGLGLNPADGSLFIATHTGLWRVPRGASRAERVGGTRQDTMGFTVVGNDHFLGSGHPDPREARDRGLPPHLGLIESRDAGETWTPVSLLGAADFHVLRFRRGRVYGYDASNDRLLVSRDHGRSWAAAERPAPIVDLAVAPDDSRHVVTATADGLFASRAGGASWQRVGDAIGLLAWPARRSLFLVTGDGSVLVSRDSGRRWSVSGTVGGEPAALLAPSPRELYVALHDGAVHRSRDGGRSWTIRSSP